MLQHLLAELEAEQARFGERRQPACTDDQVEQLRRRVREQLGAELPDAYAAFLRGRNGLNHNGLFIYASETAPVVGARDATIQGLVEANLVWRDDEDFLDCLVFGDGNMDVYVRHLPTGEYQVRDRVPGNLVERFASFDELLAAAIKAHL